jgi:hypothetical protein
MSAAQMMKTMKGKGFRKKRAKVSENSVSEKGEKKEIQF